MDALALYHEIRDRACKAELRALLLGAALAAVCSCCGRPAVVLAEVADRLFCRCCLQGRLS